MGWGDGDVSGEQESVGFGRGREEWKTAGPEKNRQGCSAAGPAAGWNYWKKQKQKQKHGGEGLKVKTRLAELQQQDCISTQRPRRHGQIREGERGREGERAKSAWPDYLISC